MGAERGNGLPVVALALVGDEVAWLRRILEQWYDDGFSVDEDKLAFAADLMAKLDAQTES